MATATKLLRISEKSKESFDKLNTMYNFTTHGEQLETMVNFFLINKFNPRDLNFNNIESLTNNNRDALIKLSNDNTERIIKIIRNIEINSIDNINRKTTNIEKGVTAIYNDLNNKKVEEKITQVDNNFEDLKIKYQSTIELNNKLLFEKEKLESEKNEYHRCLETLNKSLKIVNDNGDRKAYFNIEVKEVENLFYLIP